MVCNVIRSSVAVCLFMFFLSCLSATATVQLAFADTKQQIQPAKDSGKNPSLTVSNDDPAAAGSFYGQARKPGQQSVMDDIIDIRPPITVGTNYTPWYMAGVVLGGILLLLLLFFLLDYYMKTRKNTSESLSVPELPPETIADSLLSKLEKEMDLSDKQYYFRLTAIVKGYLGRRYLFDAPEKTTEELIPLIAKLSIDNHLTNDLRQLFYTSDGIKYAHEASGIEKRQQDLAFVRELVLKTTPIETDDDSSAQADKDSTESTETTTQKTTDTSTFD